MTQQEKELIVMYRSTMVLAQLAILQDEIDEIERNGYVFKHNLKNTGNLFKKAMAKEMETLYKGLPVSAELAYYELTNKLAEGISKEANKILIDLLGMKKEPLFEGQKS